MIYHKRNEWVLPSQPVTGPASNWNKIDRIVVHYPGGTIKKPYNPITLLRGWQNQYLNKKPPYSLGYNWAIDENGDVWEIRGYDIKCAANVEVNEVSVAIKFIVNNAEPANEAQLAACRELVQTIWDRKGVELPIVSHASQATNSTHTPCPGAGIRKQMDEGLLLPTSPPEVTPGKIGKAMIIEYLPGTPSYTVFVTDFTTIAWVFDGTWSGIIQGAGLPKVTVNRTELLSAIKSLKPTTSWPGTIGGDTELVEAWESPRPD